MRSRAATEPPTSRTRCRDTYPGAVTLRGRPIRCELAAGHPEPHGHTFAARYWYSEPYPRHDPDGPVPIPADPEPDPIP